MSLLIDNYGIYLLNFVHASLAELIAKVFLLEMIRDAILFALIYLKTF